MERRRYLADRVGAALCLFCAGLVLVLTLAVIYVIGSRGLALFIVDQVSPREFLLGTQWWPDRPPAEGGPVVGAMSMIAGSVLVSLLAVGVSAPLGVMAAFFLVEIAPDRGRRILQTAVELLAGIPAVVYGYIGLSLLVPLIGGYTGGRGFSLLAGAIVLAVMILPTIISVSADCIRSLPAEWKHAALALGSTRWQAIRLVLMPAAWSGLVTAVVMGLTRAFGEALAVQMVIGNTHQVPTSILDPVITLTSAIVMDMGTTVPGSTWNNALWSMGLLLLLVSLFFTMLIRVVTGRWGAR